MSAPFRIRKPSATGVTRTGSGVGRQDGIKHWMDRLIRLIPSEIVAVYLAGKGYATSWLGIWAIVCLGLVLIIRIWGTKEPGKKVQWVAVVVSAISFVIWIYAMGGQFLSLSLPDPGVASAAMLVWTVVVPIFYQGD